MGDREGRGVNHIIGRITDIGSSRGDPHIAVFAPGGPPGVSHNPGVFSIVPPDKHHRMIDPPTAIISFVETENASPVALHLRAGTDRHSHRSITVEGILDRFRSRDARIITHISPVYQPVRVAEQPVTGLRSGHVGKVRFQNGPGLGLVDGGLVKMVVMGPPAPVATVPVGVTGKQKLLREVRSQAGFPFQIGLKRSDRAESPATPAITLVPDRCEYPGISPVKGGREAT